VTTKTLTGGADVRLGGVSELPRELKTGSKRKRSKAACMSAVQAFMVSLVAPSAGSAAMADESPTAASSRASTPLMPAAAVADTEENSSSGEDGEEVMLNGEVGNSEDNDAPGADGGLLQSQLIDRDVLHACGAVLVDFAGEALCQNLQLQGTRGAIDAIADALRGSLAGDALLVSGAAAANFSPSSTAAAVCLHVAYARAVQAESAAEISSLVRVASALADFLCVTLLQHRRYLDIVCVHSDRVTADYPFGVVSQEPGHYRGLRAGGVSQMQRNVNCSERSCCVRRIVPGFAGLPTGRRHVELLKR
jgi:hypothetical protein